MHKTNTTKEGVENEWQQIFGRFLGIRRLGLV
jgi:hypothetical protein